MNSLTGRTVPLTDLARKYTHPTGSEHIGIAGTGKSRLTPLPTPISPTETERARYEELDLYQRVRFQELSTQDLVDLNAFAPTSTAQVTFDDNPINALFAQNKWDVDNYNSVPFFLLPRGLGGYWQVGWDLSLENLHEQ